ncbi:unnamed protein product [Closterium sp. NIES-53]
MYLMTCTRPDLAYPLSILARYVAPGRHRPEHMTAAKRVLRYLCSTSGMGLVLGGRSPVVLTGHADASWADDQATQRSSQGYTFGLGSGSVSWRATRSSSVLGSILYVDNKAMLALCREQRLEHRTKYIALRYFLARELQQRGQLRLAYVASEANTADVFTKALAPCDHQRCCTQLGLLCFALLDWSCPPPVDPLPPQGPAPSGVSQVDAVEPVKVAVDSGAARGAEPMGAESRGAEPGGAEPGGAEPRGAESGGDEPGGAEPGGAESARVASRSASSRRELLSPQELREWFARRWSRAPGAGTGAVGTGGAAAAAGVGAADAGAAGGVGAGVGPAGGTAGATGGTGAAGLAGVGAVGAGGAADTGAASGGTVAVPVGTGGPARPRPYFVPLLEQVLGLPPSPCPPPPLECPQPVQSQSPLQPVSPLPAPSPYAGPTGGLAERREPASRPASPVRTTRASRRAPRPRPPAVPGTHQMTLRPSTAPLRVPLPSPPESSLLVLADPASDSLRAASPTVARLRSTVVTDPSFESTAASALVAELVDFAACCRLDYAVPPGANIVSDMWIFRVKRPPGSPPVFKARYVARGFSQRQGVDYFQTFSPTPKMTTLRVLLHVAAQRDYELHSLDFSIAFLQGSLHEEI